MTEQVAVRVQDIPMQFPVGGGELGRLIREFDWSQDRRSARSRTGRNRCGRHRHRACRRHCHSSCCGGRKAS